MLNNVLIIFLKAAGFVEVRAEILNWDINAAANNRERRVPDITCYDPAGTTKYIIDTRIAWKFHNDNGSAIGSYTPCKLARDGEREKWARWNGVVSAHRDFMEGATFVPYSVEIAGGFGPQAERFVETVVEWAGNVRDVSVFGWQAAN
jgi:hypothetical protein